MKKKELSELKKKEKMELLKVLGEKKVELTQLTSKIYAGREKNLKKGRNIRREIAQIMTLIGQSKVKGENK